jgi:hypothetical protein
MDQQSQAEQYKEFLQRIVCLHAEELIDLGGISAAFCLPFIALLPTAPEAPASAPAAPHAPAGLEYMTCCDHPDCTKCKGHGGHYRLTSAPDADALTVTDYEEMLTGHRRLVRELDVLLNGEAGAAKQASLCDIVRQVRSEGIKTAAPHAQAEPVAWMNPETLDVIHDTRKRAWENDFGMGGKSKAAGYTYRLAAPVPQEAEQAAPAAVTLPTNDEVFAEVQRLRGALNHYVSTNAVNDTMQAVRSILSQPAAPAVMEAEQASVLAVRAAALEEAAQACEAWGDGKIVKWADDDEMLEDAKARAWDGIQCAVAIRALIKPATTKG